MTKKLFSDEELRARAFDRLAYVLHSYWEEDGGFYNTRLFDKLIQPVDVYCGRSAKGGGRREHVVPCSALIKLAFELFAQGRSRLEVAQFLEAHLKIADISPEEASRLDVDLKLKECMPPGWKIGDDVMARLKAADIVLEESRLLTPVNVARSTSGRRV